MDLPLSLRGGGVVGPTAPGGLPRLHFLQTCTVQFSLNQMLLRIKVVVVNSLGFGIYSTMYVAGHKLSHSCLMLCVVWQKQSSILQPHLFRLDELVSLSGVTERRKGQDNRRYVHSPVYDQWERLWQKHILNETTSWENLWKEEPELNTVFFHRCTHVLWRLYQNRLSCSY